MVKPAVTYIHSQQPSALYLVSPCGLSGPGSNWLETKCEERDLSSLRLCFDVSSLFNVSSEIWQEAEANYFIRLTLHANSSLPSRGRYQRYALFAAGVNTGNQFSPINVELMLLAWSQLLLWTEICCDLELRRCASEAKQRARGGKYSLGTTGNEMFLFTAMNKTSLVVMIWIKSPTASNALE